LAIPVAQPEGKIVITQEDEDEIVKLAEEFNRHVDSVTEFGSSILPFDKYMDSDSYRKLIAYDAKLLPYLIRQFQIEEESRVFLGSSLIDEEIVIPYDLYLYQQDRAGKLREGVKPWFDYHAAHLLASRTTIGSELYKGLGRRSYLARFSWIDWWENHRDEFESKTKNPVEIDTTHKFFSHPHISTERHGNMLDIEACHMTIRRIIERAAAEMGVKAFLGEYRDMGTITKVRMRGVTFEEFAGLIGYTVSVSPIPLRIDEDLYHFGGDAESEPRALLDGWGIKMWKTAFSEGNPIPVTLITRGTNPIVDPSEPAFKDYGSFRVTNNDGEIVLDYRPHRKTPPAEDALKPAHDTMEIVVDLADYCKLPPGEYNVSFRYLTKETPTAAIEVYKREE
jgi:hypothetical protein